MQNLFCTSNSQGRELCWHGFMKYMPDIVTCQDTWELICFKLGMTLNATKLYSLITVWMTLMFTQGDMIKGKLELVWSFCCNAVWSNSNVHDGWLCTGDDWSTCVSMTNVDCLNICSSCSSFAFPSKNSRNEHTVRFWLVWFPPPFQHGISFSCLHYRHTQTHASCGQVARESRRCCSGTWGSRWSRETSLACYRTSCSTL